MIFAVITADFSLGKVDKSSFSQQTLMELLIEGITNKDRICGNAENPKDVSEWESVTLNAAGEITDIEWGFYNLHGTVNLQWLPLSAVSLELANGFFDDNILSGSIDLTNLPDGLMELLLSDNKYSGEIDLTHLPKAIQELDVSHNALSGRINVTQLPDRIRFLRLNGNTFAGVTDFSRLPDSLVLLNVSETSLQGEIYCRDEKRSFTGEKSGVKIVNRVDLFLE